MNSKFESVNQNYLRTNKCGYPVVTRIWIQMYKLRLALEKILNDSKIHTVSLFVSFISLGKVNDDRISSQHGKFSMEMIAVFNEYVPTGRVMLSYTYTSKILHNDFYFYFIFYDFYILIVDLCEHILL